MSPPGTHTFATSVGQQSFDVGQGFASQPALYPGGPQGAPQTLTPDGAAAGTSVRLTFKELREIVDFSQM